ncbi:MAG: dipeptidase [Anaerolineales bacterium]
MHLNLIPMNIIIDAHEDLAWNMVNLGRDYTQSADIIRQLERNTPIPAFNGNSLLGWPQYQSANVAIIFGTLFCQPERLDRKKYAIETYETPQEAHKCYRKNLDAYMRLTDDHPQKFQLILDRKGLHAHLEQWENHLTNPTDSPPVGIVILMEGAEGVRTPAEIERWFDWGVRIVGPAWAGNRYSGGTREPGPLTQEGYVLLERMASLGMILDISHMDHQSARQALDFFPGQVIASHSNAESLIKGIPINRHLQDETIQQLIERQGVMGIVPLNAFLNWDWRTNGGRTAMSLDDIIAQIDYVCQIAGNTNHVGFGSDFDGGFGVESVPPEIDTIADLVKLAPKLSEKGYNEDDVARIFGGNWQRVLENNLPSSW